jgi:oxidase EvaA
MKNNIISVKKIKNWNWVNNGLFHYSNNFFSIRPIIFKSNIKEINNLQMPLIIQKEHGILGIIKKKINKIDKYLLQAKIEPGNINKIQLSPTVQATKSNYEKVHGGKNTRYLNFFLKNKFKIISKFKLSEQGSRFFKKKNYNYLLDSLNYRIIKKKNYIWISKNDLIKASKKDNFLNMDTMSIISCSINNVYEKKTKYNFKYIINRYNLFKKNFYIEKKITKFNTLKGWEFNKGKFFDKKQEHFSIIGINVKTNSREISNWSQPMVKDHYNTLNGILIAKICNFNHYLLKIIFEPGFTSPKFSSTLFIRNFDKKNIKKDIQYYNLFFNNKDIMLNINTSDEGGRFYKNKIQNVIKFLPNYKKINIGKNYLWISHNQFINLIKRDLVTIEARNLFGYFNIDKLK